MKQGTFHLSRLTALALLLAIGTAASGLPIAANAQERNGRGLFDGIVDELLRGPVTEETGKRVPATREEITFSYAPLVRKIAPAVVNVYAARMVQRRRSPFEGDPFFERFFGEGAFGRRSQPRVSRSLGSGVIVGPNGVIITNVHVIEGADQIKVALQDGREFDAEILLTDKKSDLAVLRIESDEPFPSVPLGDSEDLEVGDLVLAIGNPFGVGQTVTSGIVSALARSRVGVGDFGFFIQTDASINPGNSGGALVDMKGRLIGINTAIFSRSGGSNGIGFAVPSNMVRVVLQSAESGSDRLVRPWIGATFETVSADVAESLGLERPSGALVTRVARDGPAAKAGLKPGDVVLSVDGKRVDHVDALGYRLSTAGIGRTVELAVLSRSRTRTLNVPLMAAPETVSRDLFEIGGRSPFTGATVANLSPALAQELEMDDSLEGVVVMKLRPGSPAARFGFRPKDIIRVINDIDVKNTADLREIALSRQRTWRFDIERDGRMMRQVVRR